MTRRRSPFHSAGGKKGGKAAAKARRTQDTTDAINRYLQAAGPPQQRGDMIAAFQRYPGWKAGLTALYCRIGRPQMGQDMHALLHKSTNSLLKMITDLKMGHNACLARDVLDAVKLYIIFKHEEKCGGLFR